MPLSNNADLMPSNPFIGWYTQMARKMIDDVKTKRISEADARDNIQQAYHEVMVRQAQDSRDQDEREAAARTRVRSAQAQEKATADAQQNAEDERAATIAQAKADQFCACAARALKILAR
jgi:hypothetical protein